MPADLEHRFLNNTSLPADALGSDHSPLPRPAAPRRDVPDRLLRQGPGPCVLRAVDRCEEVVRVVFLNDPPIPRGTLVMMSEVGEVLNGAGRLLARLYREAVTVPVVRGWPPSGAS